MLRYALKRILYMIPTVFGVILITFVLFNVAGGSPGAAKLGKNVTAKRLEEFDERRGYNKPLFFGLWAETRAYEDSRFEDLQGNWKMVEGVEYNRDEAIISIQDKGEFAIPLNFNLNTNETFKWEISYRLPGKSTGTFLVKDNSGVIDETQLESGEWHKIETIFKTGGNTAGFTSSFKVESGKLDVRSIRLRRRMKHMFDSQLVFYLNQILHLDFGVSHSTNQKVTTMLREGILPSLALTVPIFVVGLILAITLALICAFFRNSLIDRFFVIMSVVLMSVNYLVWLVLGQYVLGYLTRWFPVWGYQSFSYLVLPCLLGIAHGLGSSLRFYRTVMLDEMYQDYVRTAFAKGATKRRVLFRHVLRNAMIPILTSVIITIPYLYTGSLLLETFFGIPGLGRMSINALNSSDFDVIRAVVLLGAFIYIVANLVTDLSYAVADPRVRLK